MRKLVRVARRVLADVASLRRPVTAAPAVGTVLTVVKPFGISIDAEAAVAVVTGVGLVAAYVENLVDDID